MTKVAINKCYGGFSLSNEAVIGLIEMDSPVLLTDPYEGSGWDRQEFVPHGDGPYLVHNYLYGVVLKDGMVYFIDRGGDRTHHGLIAVIEELGDAVNGRFAEIKIVEIPDDVEFEIEEYDGLEWIAEKHRTWG